MNAVVVGGGVAAVTAARAVAAVSGTPPIVLAEEQVPYYYRPKLPDYLAGRLELADLIANPLDWYAENRIDYRVGAKATALDVAERVVTTAEGVALPYDALVLATGGECFLPPIPGLAGEGTFALRRVGDADRIANWLLSAPSPEAAFIGGGLLGLEAAAALAARGARLTLLEVADWLLPRQLDLEAGEILRMRVEALGIAVRTGVAVTRVARNADGRLAGAEFTHKASGAETHLPASTLMVSAGVAPNTALAAAAGLTVRRGIVVDDNMVTSTPGVYAVGDCAEHNGRIYGAVAAAVDQAKVAAAHMLMTDRAPAYRGTPLQSSLKVVGLDVTSMGETSGPDLVAIGHADPSSGLYKKLYLRDGALVGAILMGTRTGIGALGRSVAEKRVPSQEELDKLLSN